MIQRSATTVVRGGGRSALSIYSEGAVARGVTTEMADLISATIPYRLLAARAAEGTKRVRAKDADFYARLEGFGLPAGLGRG